MVSNPFFRADRIVLVGRDRFSLVEFLVPGPKINHSPRIAQDL